MRRGVRLLFLLLFVQPSLFFPLPGNPPQQPNLPQTPPIQQNPGQPLPTGSVSYRNTWNQTQPQCAYPKLTSEPLLSRDSNWTIVVNIPTLLLMGEPSSSYVKHTYTFYANGTFLARDDQGNSFAVKGLEGLPQGNVVTTLQSNSSLVLQNYLWVVGRLPTANITISYSVRRQFCQPAGLEVAIYGY